MGDPDSVDASDLAWVASGVVDNELEVEGWYKDPFGRHELRWFSAGTATNLVRDGDATSQDEPPNEPFDGPLVEADEVEVEDETVRADDWITPEDPPTMYGVPYRP